MLLVSSRHHADVNLLLSACLMRTEDIVRVARLPPNDGRVNGDNGRTHLPFAIARETTRGELARLGTNDCPHGRDTKRVFRFGHFTLTVAFS